MEQVAAGSVLVAEDERNLADALSFLMRRAGLEVTVARDGPSTVEAAQRIRPDVIVLDIMLPGFDGFEVVSTLRRQAT
ncbi:MAG: response regulator, partial [bacterium]|nr:response regulator [bacterium]